MNILFYIFDLALHVFPNVPQQLSICGFWLHLGWVLLTRSLICFYYFSAAQYKIENFKTVKLYMWSYQRHNKKEWTLELKFS